MLLLERLQDLQRGVLRSWLDVVVHPKARITVYRNISTSWVLMPRGLVCRSSESAIQQIKSPHHCRSSSHSSPIRTISQSSPFGPPSFPPVYPLPFLHLLFPPLPLPFPLSSSIPFMGTPQSSTLVPTMTTNLSPHVEIEDVVRIPNTRHLFVVERVAGDSYSDTDDDSSHQDPDDHLSTGSSATDERGRANFFLQDGDHVSIRSSSFPPPIPMPNQAAHLISSYDDYESVSVDDNDYLPSTHHRQTNVRNLGPDARENDLAPFPDPSATDPSSSRLSHQIPDDHAIIADTFTGLQYLCAIDKLTLVDRSFDPGQLVMWASEQQQAAPRFQQSAIVEKVHKYVLVRRIRDITPATVDKPDPATCFQVPSHHLGFFTGVRAGDSVVLGSWVGIIDYFVEEVYVEFPDRSLANIPGHSKSICNRDPRTPDRTRRDPFREGMFYPGQRVLVMQDVLTERATWIRGEYSGVNEGIVKYVRVRDLGVEFVAKSMYSKPADESERNSMESKIAKVVQFDDVNLLESFRDLWWSVGDLGLLKDGANPGDSNQEPGQAGSPQQVGMGPLPSLDELEGDEDGEWEEEVVDGEWGQVEDDESEALAGAASSSSGTHSSGIKARSKKPGGRLTKAHRRARERGSTDLKSGTVSGAAIDSLAPNPDDVVQVVETKSFVDLLWQDGTRSKGIPALNLWVNNHPDAYDYLPGEIVIRADEELYADESLEESGKRFAPRKKGAIISVNQAERTAVVMWQRGEGLPYSEEEEVSVYELRGGDYAVSIGDTVLHVPREPNITDERKEWVGVVINQSMGECSVAWNGGGITQVPCSELLFVNGDDDMTFETEESTELESDRADGDPEHLRTYSIPIPHDAEYNHNWGSDDDGDLNHLHLAPMPNFDDYGSTLITSLLHSRELCKFVGDLDKRDYQNAVSRAEEKISRDLQMSREKNDRSRQGGISKNEESAVAAGLVFHALGELFSGSINKGDFEDNLPASNTEVTYDDWALFHDAVAKAFERILKADIRTPSLNRQSNEETPSPISEVKEVRESEARKMEESGTPGPISQVKSVTKSEPSKEEQSAPAEEEQQVIDSELRCNTERFKVIDDLPNFHVFSNLSSSSSYSAKFLSVIRKEWNRLRKNLPEGILVWACEEKLDRVRAGIIGPQGTPYADIIFFFDIRLSPSYPITPPEVWFHSHGRRLNPNLYEDGKVCLSILGTWDGDDVESWDAKTSNLLRLLLSLQALVFVDEPYYNEAGYGKQRGTDEGRINSRVYNESAFLLSIRHMIQTLRSSGVPEDCRNVAVNHYQQAAIRVLTNCKKLVAAELEQNGLSTEHRLEESAPYSSSGFRKSLSQLLKPLENAISSCCDAKRV